MREHKEYLLLKLMLIKIQLSPNLNKSSKFLIYFVPQLQPTIADVLSRVIELTSLNASHLDLEISQDGYLLPPKMSSSCLNGDSVYKIKLNNQRSPSSSPSSSQLESDDQSQSQSSQTPQNIKLPKQRLTKLIQQEKNKISPIKKHKNQRKEDSSSESQEPPQKKKRKIAQPESDSSSDSPLPLLKNKQVKPVQKSIIKPIRTTKRVQISQSSDQSSEQIIVPKVQQKKKPLFVPSSIKNKPFRSFAQNQQQKWTTVTKQHISRWNQTNQKAIVHEGNKIRFKIMDLDTQKFIPITSGWITGTIKEVIKHETSLLIKMENVTKESNEQKKPEFQKQYQIPFINMQQLQINRDLMSQEQKEFFLAAQQKPVKDKPKQEEELEKKQSLQEYVCGQTNYYFSDKNYTTDLFMQMHADKHQDKYIPIKFILNCPKIKKVLRDEDKLWEYLENDERREERNYELNGERMIRKKQQIE